MKKILLSMLCLGALTAYAGDGTADSPYTVADVIAAAPESTNPTTTDEYVKGYIVGYVNGQSYESGIRFTATAPDGEEVSQTNIVLADAADVTDASVCIPVQLPSGSCRTALNLNANPDNLGKLVTLQGGIAKYFLVPGFKSVKSYVFDGDTPVEPDKASYGYVKAVTAGKAYLLYAEGKIATPLSGSYGYLSVVDATIASNKIEAEETNEFTIEATTGGYYIKDSNGKYLYQTGTYNSFNVSTDLPEDGAVWTIEVLSDGTAKIVNASTSKYVQYSTNYTSYGCYADATGTLPYLFEKGNAGTDIPDEPVTPVETVDVNSIAEFLAAANTEAPSRFTFPITALYQNGSYLYVTDGTTPLLIYGQTGKTYVNGDIIPAGVTGTYQNYSNGQLQMSSIDAETFLDPTSGSAIQPEVYQVEEVATDLVSTYIKILGATVAATDNAKTFTLSDNTGEIQLYNQFGLSINAGENLTFEGFIAVHSGTLQLLPNVDMGESEPVTPPVADENVCYFVAPTYTDVEGTLLFNKDGSDTQSANTDINTSLCGVDFTCNGITLQFSAPEDATYFTGAYGAQVRWYQGNYCTLTPASGVTIKQIYVQTVANSNGNFTAYDGDTAVGTVEGGGTGASDPITWTGSITNPLKLVANKAIRFSYIKVTTDGYNAVNSIEIDNSLAPVEYYNLQGIRVANPTAGQLLIRRQGTNVSKILF
ncbi:MAG: DUF6359 domain-containing protein [Bacteroidales bacterium]|nr:DUF6359 domain-containing protein [Bacteroidales bacterium]